uniref:chromate resistance protein ChrB domain-containing protein n=1 Tax=Pedobacter sp. TaxID=1411316 RepID=UPI00159935B1|nr:chromate resistance protein ChrB domain-containing protein [Pedobacter sp.]QJS06202.1 Chromate resistance protein ChrB1 [Pedobacter sp.]
MKWITRERPKIDRIACPWLIKRFIDNEAEIIYVPFDQVIKRGQELGATPFDIPNVEYTHYEDKCTFDYFLKKHQLEEPALQRVALIVRGADTDVHNLASPCSGLWAISAGLAHNISDDMELLEKGMLIYDALYSWAKYLHKEKHTQNPIEHLLVEVYNKYIKQKGEKKKVPEWALELKEIIQDQIDTNLSLSLKDVSGELNVHPAYLSREFSKHFDNLSFGEYIRKLRIEKAVKFLEASSYSISEIAYLTGFSDQSHFTRIFKKSMNQSPSGYKKSLQKGKKNSNS